MERGFRSISALALSLLAACLGACATAGVQRAYFDGDPDLRASYVYGGTTAILHAVGGGLVSGDESSIAVLLLPDLPLSFAADTLLLPLAIYEESDRASWGEADFLAWLVDSDPSVRMNAMLWLQRLDAPSDAVVDAFARSLDDPDLRVRVEAGRALARIAAGSGSAGRAALEQALDHRDPEVRAATQHVLETNPEAKEPTPRGSSASFSLDLRLSLALDTALLPLTIPMQLVSGDLAIQCEGSTPPDRS